MKDLPNPDVFIAGAGIIGLSLALELHRRGATVTVYDPRLAMQQTSSAAAGMLATDDPYNPPALLPLAQLSRSLYPEWLARIEAISGLPVPFQTRSTIQHVQGAPPYRLDEYSIDPRQLASALLGAVRATSIQLREQVALHDAPAVETLGAWAGHPITPRKGQMLRVKTPATLELREVYRSEHIYIVPRLHGPQTGTALLGATIEDAGFNTTPHPQDLARLRAMAAELLPAFASEIDAPQVEAWAGLRPATPDELPLLGAHPTAPNRWLATGHYRNGILLAPATAVVVADLLEGNPASVDLTPFNSTRFRR